ncbi:hypothetical protein [Paenibacillus graminis]|uniref:hypothetical protein n=1 Tax=Paenibacillus graminis TaxID=189425 RepID=UPI002DB56ABB|nr:hypothetical protein [Paenibacillus graminis]MEC0170846.1 hypothetical protein [Paenibacillus graminis]
MTQIPRDWQKDMERVLESRELCKKYGIMPQEESIDEVLAYWLQEAKKLAEDKERLEWMVQRAAEGIAFEKARADAAEAREQRLKEAIELAIKDGNKYENPYESLITLQSILRTLYPDTPAPISEE